MNKFLWALFLAFPGSASATYRVSCSGTPFTVVHSSLTSVLGEVRSTVNCSTCTNPTRLHLGVDVTNTCRTGRTAQSIVAGKVISCTSSEGPCVKIVDTANPNHAFVYDHVTLSTAGTIGAGVDIGDIDSQNHLHLQEDLTIGGQMVRINPLYAGRMDYFDAVAPSFVNTSMGSLSNQAVFFVQESPGQDSSYSSDPTPISPAVNGIYYLRGQIDILANLTQAYPLRKGVFAAGYSVSQNGITSSLLNIYFDQIPSGAGGLSDAKTIYLRRNDDSMMYFVTNRIVNNGFQGITADGNLDTSYFSEGPVTICPFAISNPQPWNLQVPSCYAAVFDRTPPTVTMSNAGGAVANGGATSTTTITIEGTDTGGVYTINLTGPGGYNQTSTNSAVTTTYSDTFGSGTPLVDGSYVATITDLAGNVSVSAFSISTSTPSTDTQDDKGGAITDVIPSSRCIVIHARDSVAGIASISISGTGLSKTLNYSCGVPAKSTDVYTGAFCNLTENSTYTYTVTSCSGKETTSPEITIATSTKGGRICVTSPAGTFCGATGSLSDAQLHTYGMRMRVCHSANCSLCTATGTAGLAIVTSPAGGNPYCDTGPTCCRMVEWNKPLGYKLFSVSNTTDVASGASGSYEFSITTTGSEGQVSIAVLNSPNFTMGPSQGTGGSIDVAQIGQGYPTSSSDGTANVNSPFTRLHFTLRDLLEFLLPFARQLLRASTPYVYNYIGSDAILNSTTTLTLSYTDAVNTDTTTARIYMFDGVTWSSSGITNQSISYSTTSHLITASGSIDRTGLYAALYQAQDSSAPITTLDIQGSSFSFDGTVFVSTDAYLVLTATDPVVGGFASTVASVTYRIDPTVDSEFFIYTTSIPVSLGTHVIEYRSLDYAGNTEVVKTATFTATAGAAMRGSSTAKVPGVLLNGFLGSGAEFEIESQAENDLTLLISSANRAGVVAVDNIGEVGIGVTPQSNLNIGQGSIALQLRSGNSTSAVTSNQITLGYNGDYSMRHLMRTVHSTATHGNRMDFLVWNTGAGSTTTLASLNVLSLQGIATASGGSFHVQPVGEPDAEVEVSNGLSTGGGTMQRLQVVAPSSRRFKTDIKDLSAKDEDRALEDVSGLKHARFRYKSRQKDGRLTEDPAQTLHTGLIYEEAPTSIREGGEALSTSERLVNVELALKAEMRRLEELQKRYEKLKARRTTP